MLDQVIDPSSEAIAALREVVARVRGGQSQRLFWSRILNHSERQQLGGDLKQALRGHGSAVSMWRHLRGGSEVRATIEVAYRLGFLTSQDSDWLVREYCEPPDEEDAVLQHAISTTKLVIVLSAKSVYWDGQKLDADWGKHKELWSYFTTLCESACVSQSVDGETFNRPGSKYITYSKSRLKSLKGFPPKLHQLIRTTGTGRQRLDLDPAQIRIFDHESSEVLRECR